MRSVLTVTGRFRQVTSTHAGDFYRYEREGGPCGAFGVRLLPEYGRLFDVRWAGGGRD